MQPKENQKRTPIFKYLREDIFPTIFCPGCGGGTVLNCYARAVDELGLDLDKMVSVTGIGCSSWIVSPYFKCDTLHTTHGRAIAFASGVQVMKPEMSTVVIAGDGDISGIGGNHLIHAARRNINLKVFLVNNFIYAMTGGQVAPTTPHGVRTSTTPYNNIEYPLNISEMVIAAGANYVARWTTYHVFNLVKAMKKALTKKGFCLVEIISQCPTAYGKYIRMREAADFLKEFSEKSVPIKKARKMEEEQLEDKIVVGTLVERNREDFVTGLQNLNRQVQEKEGLSQ